MPPLFWRSRPGSRRQLPAPGARCRNQTVMKPAAMRRIIRSSVGNAGHGKSLARPASSLAFASSEAPGRAGLAGSPVTHQHRKQSEPVRMHPMHRSRLAAAAALSHRSQ
ncbi:hypothetical protein Lal_00037241 [Lupinus albus]|nr:hypothetical protein Lal_00037241 [Lupinus albus]